MKNIIHCCHGLNLDHLKKLTCNLIICEMVIKNNEHVNKEVNQGLLMF